MENRITTPTELETLQNQMLPSLDDLVRQGAQRMLEAALEAEVESYLTRFTQERDEKGRALVVRNGHAQERTLRTGAGVLKIRAPRVNDTRTEGHFSSHILPPYMRRAPRLESALPVLYLRGLSTGDFKEALSTLLGEEAVSGFSPTTITRLLSVWQEEYRQWQKRSLLGKEYVYIWADGVHFNVRLDEDRLACLVVIGVTPHGDKEVIALEDGYRESTESWAALLRDLKARGLKRPPKLAIADGALGFWAALRDVYPETEGQRCWVHKIANVLDKMAKSIQPKAKAHLHEIMRAPDRKSALNEIDRFEAVYGAKYPKAVATLTKDIDALLTFMNFPAAHWIHLRTSNAIESAFATVRLRTRTTKGAGSRAAGLAMAFKLITMAEANWRRVNSPHLANLVWDGFSFPDGETKLLPDLAASKETVIKEPVEAVV